MRSSFSDKRNETMRRGEHKGGGRTPMRTPNTADTDDFDGMINMLSELANDMPKTTSSSNKDKDSAWLDKLLSLPDIGKMLKSEMKRDKVENIQKKKQQQTQDKLSHLEKREQEYRRRIAADQQAIADADAEREQYEYDQLHRVRRSKKSKKRKDKRLHNSAHSSVMFRPALTETAATPVNRQEHLYQSQKKMESEARAARMRAQENELKENKRRELDLQLQLAELRLQEIKNQQKRDIDRKREGRRERTLNAKDKAEAAVREKAQHAKAKVRRSQERQARVDFERCKREELRNVRRQVVMKILSVPNLKELIMEKLGDQFNSGVDGPLTSIRGSPRSLGRDEIHDSFVHEDDDESMRSDELEDELDYIDNVDEDSLVVSGPMNHRMAVGSAVQAARNRQNEMAYPTLGSGMVTGSAGMPQQPQQRFEDTPFGAAAKLAEAAFVVAAASTPGANVQFDDSAFRRAAALSQTLPPPIEVAQDQAREEKVNPPSQVHMVVAQPRSRSAGRSRDSGGRPSSAGHSREGSGGGRRRPKSAGISRKSKQPSHSPYHNDIGRQEARREWNPRSMKDLTSESVEHQGGDSNTAALAIKEEMMKEVLQMKQRDEEEKRRENETLNNTRTNSSHIQNVTGDQHVNKTQVVNRSSEDQVVDANSNSSSSRLVNKLLNLLHEEQSHLEQQASAIPTGSIESPVRTVMTRNMSNYSPDFLSPTTLASTRKDRRKNGKTVGGNGLDVNVSGISGITGVSGGGSFENLGGGIGNNSTGTGSTVGERQLQRIQAMQASQNEQNLGVSNLNFDDHVTPPRSHPKKQVKESSNHQDKYEASDPTGSRRSKKESNRRGSRVHNIREQTVQARQQQFHGYNVT